MIDDVAVKLARTEGEMTRPSLGVDSPAVATSRQRSWRVTASDAFVHADSTRRAALFPLGPAAPAAVNCAQH